MKDAFSSLHPFVCFAYYFLVIGFSMFIMNPVCLAVSLLCALANALYLNGRRAARLSLVYVLPLIILVTIINPLFNHQGVTILSYFSWGNPLTLESIIYGVASAFMLSCVILWFSGFNSVMTSDKIIFLFGKISPSLSLIISMTLRFVPKFSAQLKNVRNAQRCIGCDVSNGRLFARIKNSIKILSIMLTWSLEGAIETADSMKSRGHGLKGRTAYSIYRFDRRDGVFLGVTLALGAFIIISAVLGSFEFLYFPTFTGELFTIYPVSAYICYAALMLMPLILNAGEGAKWKKLRSAI